MSAYYTEPDFVLEEDDYEIDDDTGELKLYKQVCDATFEKGELLHIVFIDEDYEPMECYRMVAEDKDYIYCEYVG